MNRYKTTLVISLMALVLVILVPIGMSLGGQPNGDRSEAAYCGSCHHNPAQVDIAAEWNSSAHGNSYQPRVGNTYCAKCHSPFQADPAANHSVNDPIPIEEWEGVTCAACHPPHDLRVEWGTPIGNYDVAAGEWTPVYEDDIDDLCEFCHSGSRHGVEFQGYGTIMDKKTDLTCVDCHMYRTLGTSNKEHQSHTFKPTPASCGLENEDCHDNHKEDWAEKQIEKGVHEKGSYGQEKGK